MTEVTGETIDQGFADLDAGQADIEGKLDALSAEETKELQFLADLENARGAGQLAPDQQARLDDLKARQAKVSAALDAAREELAQADGTEPAPTPSAPGGDPVGTPVDPGPLPNDPGDASGVTVSSSGSDPAPSDTPIADSVPAPAPVADADSDGAMTGGPVESVHDAGDEPAANET